MVYWQQFGFLLLQHASAVYERNEEDHTEITEEITEVLIFFIPAMKH